MKKTLSLLLAVAFIMTVAVTAIAADQNSSIVLGNEADEGMALSNSLLMPGESYRFPVYVSVNGAEAAPLTAELLEDYSFKISNTGKGASLNEFKLAKVNNVYYINVDVKAGWPAVSTEEEYSMKLTSKASGKDSLELTVEFETGYPEMPDEYIDSLAKDDAVEVNNDTPVFSADQLKRISKLNGGRKVVFEGANWSYEANVSGMESINMLNNANGIKEILLKYQDNSFEFLTFPAGTKFNGSGRVEIDASAFAEEFNETFYVYRYLNGKLTAVACSYDTEVETLSFSTDTLGRFVITDRQIKDTVVIENFNGSSSQSGSITNPNTGAAV